jgi:NAD(P)-dependent dehydrogenase (short-subunit alcohol dehydrogenase family)
MKKQTIIVTGATSVIGKAIARLFLKNGDNVVLNSLSGEKLDHVYNELGGGENLTLVVGDVSDRVTGIKLLASAIARFGSVDVLVNDSGSVETRSFFQVDEAYFNNFSDTLLKGAFFITQGVIPQMLKQGKGIVFNIDRPLLSHFSAKGPDSVARLPRGAIHSLTLQLAAQFSEYNIRFITITPEAVPEAMTSEFQDWITEIPVSKRAANASEVAQMIFTIAKQNS